MKYRAGLVPFSLAAAAALAVPAAGCGLVLDTAAPDTGLSAPPDGGPGRDSGVLIDAGVDASRPDGSRPDASPSDASRDTGPAGTDAALPPPDPDPRVRRFSCDGVPDGTPCQAVGHPRQICVGGGCQASWCGDGVVDPVRGEQCDDSNDYDGDSCDNNCQHQCIGDSDCDDGRECTGEERCVAGACQAGVPLPPGASCSAPIGAGRCNGIYCFDPSFIACGNGLLGSGEECDDGNNRSGDGCEPDCTITCDTDRECAALSFVSTDPCRPISCTMDHRCDDSTLIPSFTCYRDGDGDGYGTSATAFPICGMKCPPGSVPLPGDCADDDRRAHPGTRLYFTEEVITGGWDFDCDGVETRFGGDRVFAGCTNTSGGCRGGGWEGTLPRCAAEDAVWVSCVPAGGECAPSRSTLSVVCR